MIKPVRYFLYVISLAFVLLLPPCYGQQEGANTGKGTPLQNETVLFIGNSHTYYNQGLATHLQNFRISDQPHMEPIIAEVARGGYTLENHRNDTATRAKLKERAWDFVIFQENSSVASEMQPSSIDAAIALAEMIPHQDTKILLFMTWPYKERPEMLVGIRKTYEVMAEAIGATIVPVGERWSLTDTDLDLVYYDPDGIHASLEGTFYASAIFYKAIYGKSPSANPYTAGLPKETADYLKSKAE